MALSASMIIEVQNGGSDTSCSGAFNPGNANFPTDGAVTSANTASPVFSSASYTFVAGDVGSWLFVKSGTNTVPGWYKIASVSAGAATLTAGIGTAPGYAAIYVGNPQPKMNTSAGCGTASTLSSITWGIDYSQQSAAKISYTDLVIGATTTQFTSAGNPVGKNLVGNHIKITSGTGFTVGVYEVVSVTGTTATCDRALGTAASTGGNGFLGGAIASVGQALSFSTYSMQIFIKYSVTPYQISSISTNVSGGCWIPIYAQIINGYNTSRYSYNTDLLQPTIQVASGLSSATLLNGSGAFCVNNIAYDGNLQTSSCFSTSLNVAQARNCTIKNCSIATGANIVTMRCFNCKSLNNSVTNGNIFGGPAYACEATNNTISNALYAAFASSSSRCIAYSNTGTGFFPSSSAVVSDCTAYGNTGIGIDARYSSAQNCHSEANTGAGYGGSSSFATALFNCSDFNNGGGRSSGGMGWDVNPITLTSSAFVNAAGGNFTLNNNAGGGALLRAAAFPGVNWPDGLTQSYADIGAAQHQDAGGSSGTPAFAFIG